VLLGLKCTQKRASSWFSWSKMIAVIASGSAGWLDDSCRGGSVGGLYIADWGGIIGEGTVGQSVWKVELVPLHWSFVCQRIGFDGGWKEVVHPLSLIAKWFLLLSSLLLCSCDVGHCTGDLVLALGHHRVLHL